MVKSLNGGAAAHTALTDLDNQKLFSRGMVLLGARLHIFLKHFCFFSKYYEIISECFPNLTTAQLPVTLSRSLPPSLWIMVLQKM